MNKTANFQLNQWEKTDRVMMEDFNADNAKLDAALFSKLGRAELITTITTDGTGRTTATIPLAGIDWDKWQAVFFVNTLYTDTTKTLRFSAYSNDHGVESRCSDTSEPSCLAFTTAGPFMLAFFPLNDGSRPVRALYWGGHAGMGTANCTYNELTHLHASYSDSATWYFSAKRQYPVWGIR